MIQAALSSQDILLGAIEVVRSETLLFLLVFFSQKGQPLRILDSP